MRAAEPARRCVSTLILCLLALAALGSPTVAHESRPVYIELTETAPQRYQLQWKSPPSLASFEAPMVALESCERQSRPAELDGPDGLVRRTSYRCPQGLSRHALTIAYPGPNPSISSLIRYRTASGERHIAVLSPEDTRWVVPQAETASGVARQYVRLGIEHIWTGFDHLLFLVCLLWIAGTMRRIAITITGFTVAHSATLVLSALELVRLPIPPVEAIIALSTACLATEIVKGPRRSLTWRHPIAVSSSFGLLHGFGFAAALSEIGLPQTELLTGLLFFSAGVEIGQLLFAAAAIGLMRLLQRAAASRLTNEHHAGAVRSATGYAVGGLAAFWLIERCMGF